MRLQRMILISGLLSLCLGCFGVKTTGSHGDIVSDISQGSGDDIVGSVNGIMIGLDAYQQAIDKVMKDYSGQLGGEITDPQTRIYAQDNAWRQIVNRIIFHEQISRYGIRETDDALALNQLKNAVAAKLNLNADSLKAQYLKENSSMNGQAI